MSKTTDEAVRQHESEAINDAPWSSYEIARKVCAVSGHHITEISGTRMCCQCGLSDTEINS